jgi:hypothetical protein
MSRFATPMSCRAALIAVALGVACLGLPSTSALAAPTTTTLPAAIVAAGDAYALHLLDAQPIPPDARAVTSLPTPLSPEGSLAGSADVDQAHRLYMVPTSASVMPYINAHLPKGEKSAGTGTGYAPHTNLVYYETAAPTCVGPHILSCGVYFTSTEAKNGEQELRVDAQVIYLPILHVTMPTDGTVTVTGFGKTSPADPSSDPSSVVLTHQQSIQLRSAISHLKDMGQNGGCMEDSILLKIKVAKNGKVVWSAIADECPGGLTITSATSNQILDNRSCAFWNVVDSFFSSVQASGTKSASHQICSSP